MTEFTLRRDCTVIKEFIHNQLRVIDRFVYDFFWPIPEDVIRMIWMGKPIKKADDQDKEISSQSIMTIPDSWISWLILFGMILLDLWTLRIDTVAMVYCK